MRVRDIMDTKVITVPIGSTYRKVVHLLTEGGFSSAPVVDHHGKIVGFVSVKDLFRILYPFYSSFSESPESYTDFEARETKPADIAEHPVEGFMSTKVWSVDPDMPILRAGAIMLAKGIHRMPVMEDGILIGMVSRSRIFRKVFEMNFNA